jgi:hypothetical protein
LPCPAFLLSPPGAPKLRRGKKVRPPAFLKTKLAPPKTRRLPLPKKGTGETRRNPRLRGSMPRRPRGLPLSRPPALKLLLLPRKRSRLPSATP